MIRLAAVGDVHFAEDARGSLASYFEALPECADLFLIAGDITRHGDAAEAAVFADEIANVEVPIVVVLGNHDFHLGQEKEIADVLREAGADVLEGEARTFEIGETTVGVAGTKGFGGGFVGACASDFGESLMKAFVRHTIELSDQLRDTLAGLDSEVKIALTHYSPVEDTLVGERPEIYPFLGSYLLAEAIDAAGVDLAIHGHAHGGSPRGVTIGGVRVRNVAQPLIRAPYALFCLGGASTEAECEPA